MDIIALREDIRSRDEPVEIWLLTVSHTHNILFIYFEPRKLAC